MVAAIEPTRLDDFDEQALFAALDRRLAAFKQPRSVCCFEQLPRLASGKLDRVQIRRDAPSRLRRVERLRRA